MTNKANVGSSHRRAFLSSSVTAGAAAMLTGSKATLRLHLKNGTSIDLPCDDTELKRLTLVLCEAFGPVVIEHLKSRGWV